LESLLLSGTLASAWDA